MINYWLCAYSVVLSHTPYVTSAKGLPQKNILINLI